MSEQRRFVLTEALKATYIRLVQSSTFAILLLEKNGMDDKLRFEWELAQEYEKPTVVLVEKGVSVPDEITESRLFVASAEFEMGNTESLKEATEKLLSEAMANVN